MTVADFIDDLTALGEELQDPQGLLAEFGNGVVEDMRANVPVDTGALRNSINYIIADNQIQFSMLIYGIYQNYGVFPNYNPTSYHKPFTNRFGGIAAPEGNPFGVPALGYQNRQFGLPRRKFFDWTEITQQLSDNIAEQIADF